jgi:hypothetical protein
MFEKVSLAYCEYIYKFIYITICIHYKVCNRTGIHPRGFISEEANCPVQCPKLHINVIFKSQSISGFESAACNPLGAFNDLQREICIYVYELLYIYV